MQLMINVMQAVVLVMQLMINIVQAVVLEIQDLVWFMVPRCRL